MRSSREIAYRLRQEAVNLWLFARPPRLPDVDLVTPLAALPDPAFDCERIAEEILRHRFPLLGLTIDTGPEIHWRRDYLSGRETGLIYFRRIPYLDAAQAGDHKIIWELNRHQHLVLLAQAFRLTGRCDFLDEIRRQIESWLEQNPLHRGINWSSALEVGFRAISWLWIYHLAGDQFADPFRHRFLQSLYHHGLHLAANLSFYFSPNTHLLGEAVALHALGRLFTRRDWEQTGARVVRRELDRQVRADGSHFEQSTYYHLYALDMFLFHAVLSGADAHYRDKLARMADFLNTLLGPSGLLPMLGDDDGGRLFHPYGPRDRFALATLDSCAAFLNRPEWSREQAGSRLFPDAGLISMVAGGAHILFDAGPFGEGSAGHSHADTLSIVVRLGAEPVLIDPGTYTYVGDSVWRDHFRGTAAHNTIRIDGLDQAIPAGPFSWKSRPTVRVLSFEGNSAAAECAYAGFRRQRALAFDPKLLRLVIRDRIEGSGEHLLEQFWHFGVDVRQCSPCSFQIGAKALITFELPATLSEDWISPTFGAKSPAPVACITRRATLPAVFTTILDLSGAQ